MCPCPYCQRQSGPISGCPCLMCERAVERSRSDRNLAALSAFALVGGDVRGYGALPFPYTAPPPASSLSPAQQAQAALFAQQAQFVAPPGGVNVPRGARLSNYGQRGGGCGCNGSR
jgi:hypothetical protein